MSRERKPGNLKPGRPIKYHYVNDWPCHFCGRVFDTKNAWIRHVNGCNARDTYQYEQREGFCLIIYGNYFRIKPQKTDCKRSLRKSIRAMNQMGADTTTRTNSILSLLVGFSSIDRLTFEVISKEEAASIKWETPVINAETV